MQLYARGKQAHNTVPSQCVHLIVSQGGPPIPKASMTKHRNATKTAGHSNTHTGGDPSKDALGHENKQNEILNAENTITLFTPIIKDEKNPSDDAAVTQPRGRS